MESYKLMCSRPSVFLCLLLVLGIVLGVGVWAVTQVADNHSEGNKAWYGCLLAVLIVLALVNALLLFALLVCRRRHRELLEALLPRQVLKNLYVDGGLMLSKAHILQADTPADMLLNMLGELLEGRTPDLRDVIFIRTALMSNMDVYRPLNLKNHIKGANLDADVAQSLMNQLGGGSNAPPSTSQNGSRGMAREAVRVLKSLTLANESTGRKRTLSTTAPRAPCVPPGKSSQQQQQGLTQQQQQQPQQQQHDQLQGCETLASALALILTPQPACWQDAPGSADDVSDAVASEGHAASRDGRAPAAALNSTGPPGPSGLLEKAAGLLLHRDRSRRRTSIGNSREGPPTQIDLTLGSTGGTPRAAMHQLSSAFTDRRSLAGTIMVAPAPHQVTLVDLRAAARLSCGTVPAEEHVQHDDSASTMETGDGAVSGTRTAPSAAVTVPRRLSAVWDMLARRGTGSLGALARKASFDERVSNGPGVGSYMAGRPTSTQHNPWQLAHAASELLQHAHSRLGTGLSRVASTRSNMVVAEVTSSAAVLAAAASSMRQALGPPMAMIEEVERLLAQADGWQFNTWALQEASSGHALSCLGFYLIQRTGLIDCFRLKAVTLARLLRQIEADYMDQPYHNSTHATDVLQTLHVIIHASQLQVHYLDPLGLLAAYYAAIVHDYGHPGLTNDFLIATSNPLAVRYNDRSPLENHHCAASFSLLQRPELDALAPLSKSERSNFRKQVIELVLATDMKQHFSILSHFNTVHRLAAYTQQQQQQQLGSPPLPPSNNKAAKWTLRRTMTRALSITTESALDPSVCAAFSAGWTDPPPKPVDDTERSLSLQVALKCADIGHLGEALEVHKRWLGVLEEEFFQQGDRESELGLPISPLFDRSKQGVSKSQVGFYDFVALPLVHALSSAFPGAHPLMKCFLKNYNHWRVVDGQTPVELPHPTGSLRRSGSARTSAQNGLLGTFLLSVPDDAVDAAKENEGEV